MKIEGAPSLTSIIRTLARYNIPQRTLQLCYTKESNLLLDSKNKNKNPTAAHNCLAITEMVSFSLQVHEITGPLFLSLGKFFMVFFFFLVFSSRSATAKPKSKPCHIHLWQGCSGSTLGRHGEDGKSEPTKQLIICHWKEDAFTELPTVTATKRFPFLKNR